MNKLNLTSVWVVSLWVTIGLALNSAVGADVEIVGSEKFTNQITNALTLLKNKAPEAYLIVTNYVKRIKQGEHSGMWAYNIPPTFEMGDRTTFYSVTWCAAAIAHDSFHSKLYNEYKKAHGQPIPDEIWTGTEAEKKCCTHQLEVMNSIGAPKHEIEHAKQQQNTGKYYDVDYKKRDW